MTVSEKQASRLKSVLVGDKVQDNKKVCQIIKDEIVDVLQEYLCLSGEQKLTMIMNDKGELEIVLTAKAQRIKNFGIIT